MAKQIHFTYDGKDYTLEYTRRTVRQMEADGFNAQEIDVRPMMLLPALFAGAFKAHHRNVKREDIDQIFDAMPDKEELVQALAEMYSEPIRTLLEEPDEGKKVQWTVSQ